jgi:hypothetical protein
VINDEKRRRRAMDDDDDYDNGSILNSRPSAAITLSHKSISARVGSVVWKGKSGMASAKYFVKTHTLSLEDDYLHVKCFVHDFDTCFVHDLRYLFCT